MFTITKSFNWSPNGYDIETIEAGDHETLPDRAVVIAGELGFLVDAEAEKKAAEEKAEAEKLAAEQKTKEEAEAKADKEKADAEAKKQNNSGKKSNQAK
ncbi:hypothetical protein GZ77_20500 [Endozoicomonas montiporae]|uniref:Uncharacterized protein n=2 Tax=Endozoicomonas montiporae TaxID=1027273 RepID=A0A081N309_9GAMM|nr:hypothetical protein [Endozoicomonas montiporae]AMO58118.1 hypothetical protein EZMO1_4194 [Endozoicomonas montiporae CL-33]KEQ12832.1 hypothetical protein GZ77_20500 [Endozoicomonas montiporae]